jgi:hypothetical protein
MSEERLATCLRDSLLPAAELVQKYLPGMHSESATQEVCLRLPPGRFSADGSVLGASKHALSSPADPSAHPACLGEADARSAEDDGERRNPRTRSFVREREGIEAGIDLDALIGTSEWLENLLERRLDSQLYGAGAFPPAAPAAESRPISSSP